MCSRLVFVVMRSNEYRMLKWWPRTGASVYPLCDVDRASSPRYIFILCPSRCRFRNLLMRPEYWFWVLVEETIKHGPRAARSSGPTCIPTSGCILFGTTKVDDHGNNSLVLTCLNAEVVSSLAVLTILKK